MTLRLDAELPPELVPISWLIGRWEGAGVGGYPTIDEFRFGQEVTFRHPAGKPYLHYLSRSWALGDDGALGAALAQETGYWRMAANGLEVLLAHPIGYVEVWVGETDGAKVELRTDVVARTETAVDYAAGHRLYGQVDGDLLWAFDMAAVGQPLQPHLSARLKRVDSDPRRD